MTSATRPLFVHGVGCVRPDLDPGWAQAVNPADKRRSPRIWQIASVAARRACDTAAGMTPRSVVVATALGALEETRCFLEKVFTDNAGSPRNFIASVHNSMAGKLAQDFTITGPNITVCDGRNSFAAALTVADLLADSELPVLLVAVDERIALLDQLAPHLSTGCRDHVSPGWSEGAAAFVCSRAAGTKTPSLRAAGPLPMRDGRTEEFWRASALQALGNESPETLHQHAAPSFAATAFAATDLISQGFTGRSVITSLAPSSNTVAAVELCA